jgi:repressor LexA
MEMITKISRALSVPVEQLFPYPIPSDPTNIEPAVPPISMRRIPLVGNAAAGYTCLAEMQIVEYIPTDASLLHDGYEYVYLRVKGDSMEPEFHEGDLVLVRVQDTIESGEYAVVLVDGEDGLVKKIELDRVHITLISENPYYPPRRFDSEEMNRIRIFGKVISSVRRF